MNAKKPFELEAHQLCRICDPEALGFKTTDELEPLTGILGQPRVEAALEFGAEIQSDGYNIFALGPPGTGKHRLVREELAARARALPTPPDLCYVNDFDDARKPVLLQLPPGKGNDFCEDMERLVEDLGTGLRSAFEGDDYQNRRQLLDQEFKERQEETIAELSSAAKDDGLAMLRTPMGIVFAPIGEEEVITPEQFEKLEQGEKERLEEKIEEFQGRLQKAFRQFPRWQREARKKMRELNREVIAITVDPLIEELEEKYEEEAGVRGYLQAVRGDVLENAHGFLAPAQPASGESSNEGGGKSRDTETPFAQRYQVNVIVDHANTEGAPVVFEDNPTFANLIGRIEHQQQMGALVTDFNLIKAGALQNANGGYLLIDALQLLRQPYAWEGLKRALRSGQIKLESLGQAMSLISTTSLEPEPVDLALKVVLLGPASIYYLLAQHDPDFTNLFKVPADFAERMDFGEDNLNLYARLIARSVRDDGHRPFSASAVARIVEYGSRSLGDSEKISLYVHRLNDFLHEANYFATKEGAETVDAAHVQAAIDARIYRSDRIRERLREEILRGTILVDTDGEKVGQVNGLAVLQLGDFAFGKPSRITARVRLGKGEVVNIEREVDLSGPFHSKGVLILSGFLGARYAADRPLSLSASLVFEQSYGGVDGDSASSTELYALLSAISGVPIRQGLAVTGAVNQHGQVQAIGGVNQKIEGFYDLCNARGLNGDQGVLIPESNVKHLMLRKDVVAAVEAGDFHIYPVAHVDQGIEILTGTAAGSRAEDGSYPPGTINHRVEARLTQLARKARAFIAGARSKEGKAGTGAGEEE